MILVALYIPSGLLPHIFGKNHAGQTINFGGKFIYTFEEDATQQVHLKEKRINADYFENFWLKDVRLISAIVGENGTGKTTILNSFRKPSSYCKFIYEKTDSEEFTIWSNVSSSEVLYYSPFFNISQSNSENENFRDLSKYQMMIDDTEGERVDLTTLLELYNSENLKRWIKFLDLNNLNGLLEGLSLPVFDKVEVKIHSIYSEPHDTSNRFRPFFESLFEKINEERNRREQTIIDKIGYDKFKKEKLGNKIQLELGIIKGVISKIQNILESSGNKYLEEGYIENDLTEDSEEFSSQSSAKEAFYWFLENTFIRLTKKSEKILFPVAKIKNLIETLLLCLSENETFENRTKFNVNFSQGLNLIKAYEEFLLAFKTHFTFDKKVLMSFSPAKNLSSGEKSLYDLFSVLNDCKDRMENGIHTDYAAFSKREEIKDNFIILLDEADLGFHPEWKKKYIHIIQQVIPVIFKNKIIQIIITTHDPLTLSDFPNSNVVYLKKVNEQTKILAMKETDRPTRTFGANISDLLADSFFVEEGLIGDFAKEKIESTIQWIKRNETVSNRNLETFDEELKHHEKIISVIDEPIVKIKLAEMISELTGPNTFQREILNEEIKILKEKRDRLK